MKTQTSLALILAGIVGVTSFLGIMCPYFTSRRDTARNSIPQKPLEAKMELDKMRGKNTTPYQILEKVFESEESERRFKELYQRAREYAENPKIQAAESEINSYEFYAGLSGALFAASLASGALGVKGLLTKRRKNEKKKIELGIIDA